MTIYFKKKFCWLPVETYKSKHYRNGFAWFKFVFVSESGKAYKTSVDLVRGESRFADYLNSNES